MQTEIKAIDIADIIREEREKKKITRNRLSVMTGVNKCCINYYETGAVHPRFDTVSTLLSALGYELVIRKKGSNELQEDNICRVRS